jgi:hypothetical protein
MLNNWQIAPQFVLNVVLFLLLGLFLRYGLIGEAGTLWTGYSFLLGSALTFGVVVSVLFFQDRRNAIKNFVQKLEWRLKSLKTKEN